LVRNAAHDAFLKHFNSGNEVPTRSTRNDPDFDAVFMADKAYNYESILWLALGVCCRRSWKRWTRVVTERSTKQSSSNTSPD